MNPKKFLAALLIFSLLAVAAQAQTATKARNNGSTPEPKKDDGKFLQKHESFLKRTKEGPIGLLFLGDSITEGWGKAKDVWEKHYGKHNPANFGIGGDRTEHVLWRIENGELDGINPKVVVLMLGTNNTGSLSGEEIAAADTKIVKTIRAKLPNTKVLLLAIFPRGPRKNRDGSMDDGVKKMEVIRAANAQLAKLDDGKYVRFLDIGPKFKGPDGKLPTEIMPDQLHLSVKGYQIWAESIQPLLDEMIK